MSIVALKKLTLIGMHGEKETVLSQLQALGCLHVIPLNQAKQGLSRPDPQHAEALDQAIRYLQRCPKPHRALKTVEFFDLDTIVQQVLANQRQLRMLTDRRESLLQHIRNLTPWGDFQLPDPHTLAGLRFWFYQVPIRDRKKLPTRGAVWQEVYRNHRHSYIVVVAEDEPKAEIMPVPRVHTGSFRLSQLQQQLDQTEAQLEDAQAERWSLTRWLYLMQQQILSTQDRADLEQAKAITRDGEQLFGFCAWLPVSHLPQVSAFAERQGLALYAEDPAPEDQPPTLLLNPDGLAAGQDLVSFYSTPNYRTWDPSIAVFLSFTFFSAMIIADAGYGALFGVILAGFWSRLGASVVGRRWRSLGLALVVACMVWGVIVDSYFGVTFSTEHWLGRWHWVDMNDFNSLIKLAITIGVVHLSLANLARARTKFGRTAMLGDLGWVVMLCSGYSWWINLDSEDAALINVCRIGLISGLSMVLLFASEKPLHKLWPDVPLRLLGGLASLTEVTKLFGDTLSYLRLVALGLASGSLAVTFNHLAAEVLQKQNGVHILLAIIILLSGHTINIALGLLGTLVHGLRLNLIEFFNWSMSGEGYPFKTFMKREMTHE
jgi:V/A-type H+/Na+-transporting ATPase subunit I